MKKTLIRCPHCEANGQVRTLALVMGAGSVSIQRQFAKGRRDYTIIDGDNFTLYCGYCGEPAFVRKEANGTNGDQRLVWLHRESFVGTFGTV